MLLLDQPFVSNFLRRTLVENALPVINTTGAETQLLAEETAVDCFRDNPAQLLQSNSENSFDWIAENLAFSDLPRQVALLKDKVRFREQLQPLYPDFRFQAVAANELERVDVEALPLPFIIKPSVGFFSIGVHKVNTIAEWPDLLDAIQRELAGVTAVFPEQVLDTTTFIIEACLAGDEYAIDAYFNDIGNPVILNIMYHPFGSADDVSDRAYITSASIVSRNLEQFTGLLHEVGSLAGLRNFPLHAEVRVDDNGHIVPIEFNPLRFGGWCAVDMAHFAFAINPYLMFLRPEKPDWENILAVKGEELTGLIVLDRSGPLTTKPVTHFDERRLLSQFSHPLDWRPIDFNRYPVFGFLFMETPGGDTAEIFKILRSDLTEFVR
ncbi:MAG: ATP-grasp domain-containing protein [Candidatus Promineifilaceae bacterium]